MKYIKYLSLVAILAVLVVSCEKDDSTVIDPVLKFPIIDTASITPNVFDTSVVNAVAVAKVTSEEPVAKVTVEVKNPDDNSLMTVELKDDGVPPDISAGDGFYSGTISFSMTCRIVGTYQGIFLAQNISGLYSAQNNESFSVINSQNQPPVCSNLSVEPDSAKLLDSTTLVFKINAVDLNGPCDFTVFYDGTSPSNIQLTRRYLFDDGSCCPIPPENKPSGDSIAGDGIYTRILRGPPTELGYYRYHLKAKDRTGAESNVLSDSLYVYP